METRIPRMPGVEDHNSYIRFLDNRQAYDAYHNELMSRISELQEKLSVYGKAQDIERFHAEAQQHKDTVLRQIEEQEKALKEDRERFNQERDEANARLAAEQQRITQETQGALKNAREQEREAVSANEAAQKALREAEDQRNKVQAMRKELEEQVEKGRALLGLKGG